LDVVKVDETDTDMNPEVTPLAEARTSTELWFEMNE
jgi:hypothetical protein